MIVVECGTISSAQIALLVIFAIIAVILYYIFKDRLDRPSIKVIIDNMQSIHSFVMSFIVLTFLFSSGFVL